MIVRNFKFLILLSLLCSIVIGGSHATVYNFTAQGNSHTLTTEPNHYLLHLGDSIILDPDKDLDKKGLLYSFWQGSEPLLNLYTTCIIPPLPHTPSIRTYNYTAIRVGSLVDYGGSDEYKIEYNCTVIP